MNMMLRFIVRLPLWLFGTLILPWFLVPPVVLFLMDRRTGRLPVFFRWLETHDNLGFAALDVEPTVRAFADKHGDVLGMMRWLLRNKAYGLRNVIGVDTANALNIKLLSERGSPDFPRYGPAFHYVRVRIDGKEYFELQPALGIGKLRLYMRIGWKVVNMRFELPRGNSNGMFTGITPRRKILE